MVVNRNLALSLALLKMKNRKNIASMASTSRNFRRVADNNPLKRAINKYRRHGPRWVPNNGRGEVIHPNWQGTTKYHNTKRKIRNNCEQFKPALNNNNSNNNYGPGNNNNYNENELANRARRTPRAYSECKHKIIMNAYGSKQPRAMHTGGLVRKSAVHRLLKGEIVLSRAQRQGLTHGQIVKILSRRR